MTDTEGEILSAPTENQALIDVAQLAVSPEVIADCSPGTVRVVSRLKGQKLETIDLREYGDRPWRKTGDAVLHDATSFVAYVNRHKTGASVLYANRSSSQVVAVLNDHEAAHTPTMALPTAESDAANWGDFCATLALALTPEWKHWAGKDGQLQSQTAFAEHIEQGIEEIIAPPAATMLELAQHFEAHSKVEYKSVRVLQDGRRQLVYAETIDAKAGEKGEVVIPREFTLGIAPYEGTAAIKIVARLRYRLNGEALTIGYSLVRPLDVLKVAFQDVLTAIQTGTELTPLLGVHG